MNTKLDQARQAAQDFLQKDGEVSRIQDLLALIDNRTDDGGNITITIGEKITVEIPAQVLKDVFENKRDTESVTLDDLAEAVLSTNEK